MLDWIPEPKILYRVGMHSPGLSSYPFLTRWLIRIVYFVTGYQTTSQDIGLASTAERAEAMCLDDRYFYKPLYLDHPLPEDACAPGSVVWPHSEAKKWYERHYPDPVILGKEEIPLAQQTKISVANIGWNKNGSQSKEQRQAGSSH